MAEEANAASRHDPLPWRAGEAHDFPIRHDILNANGYVVGSALSLESRDLIVRLCNAHGRLADALRELLATKELHDQLETLRPLDPAAEERYRNRRVAAWAEARAALRELEAGRG